MRNDSTSINELKSEFKRLSPGMSAEIKAFVSLILKMFEILIDSMNMKANSRNSDLPPSLDPFRKKKKRKSKGKKPGGKVGHKGNSLSLDPNPDKIVNIPAKNCFDCGKTLEKIKANYISRHQVVDIKLKKYIFEYRVEHKICSCGHHQSQEPFGNSPVQYGPGLKATAVELNQIQCLPFKRCSEFFQEKFLISISPATILSYARQASERLVIWEQNAKEELLGSNVLHADETGINIDGNNWWVHVLSSEQTTLMIPHLNRGGKAIVECEVLAYYKGILSHDFWSSYSSLDVVHAACHAHLNREFEKVKDKYGQTWGVKLANLLNKAHIEIGQSNGVLSFERVKYYERKYSLIVAEGEKINPVQVKRNKSRGKIAQSYPRRLLDRLIKCRDWILLFLYDPQVPFTNNQAERDIRMLKVQQKISGCFRTEEGARDYCRIRSYMLTMQKRGYSNHDALAMLFNGS
jgi:transposase